MAGGCSREASADGDVGSATPRNDAEYTFVCTPGMTVASTCGRMCECAAVPAGQKLRTRVTEGLNETAQHGSGLQGRGALPCGTAIAPTSLV